MSERVDAKKVDKTAICGICTMDFANCEDPNLPVKNPCGCMFHEYCLYEYGGGGSFCPGSSCLRAGSSRPKSSAGCTGCKDLRREIKQLTSENIKLNKKVEQLSEKAMDSAELRKENKKLASEITKMRKKIEDVSKKLSQ